MSFLMAAIYDRFMASMENACGAAWRRELLSDLRGTVLEIGAGTGRNLDHYRDLDRLILVEPDPHMRRKLEAAIARTTPAWALEVRDDSAERLEIASESVDAVVATLVLCTVPNPRAALAEARRVLRPSGRLVFLEHVASENHDRRAWQERIDPIWKHLAGGCRLCRDTERAIVESGFEIDRIVRESARRALPIVRPTIRGVASIAR